MREFQQLEDEGSHDGFPLNMETPKIRQIRVKNEDNPEIPDHCSKAKAPVTQSSEQTLENIPEDNLDDEQDITSCLLSEFMQDMQESHITFRHAQNKVTRM